MAWKGDSRRHSLARKGIRTTPSQSMKFESKGEGIGFFKRQKLQNQIFKDASIKAEQIGKMYYKEWSELKKDIYDPAIKELKKQYNEEFLELLKDSEERMLEMQEEGSWKQSNQETIRFKKEKERIDKRFKIELNTLKENSEIQLFRIRNKYDDHYDKITDEVKKELKGLGISDKRVEDLMMWDHIISEAYSKNGSKPSNEQYLIKVEIEDTINDLKYAVSHRGID